MEHLVTWGRSGLEALGGLSVLQVGLLVALGLGLFYWALDVGLRSIRTVTLTGLLLVAALAVARLSMPETFCDFRWPAPIAALCNR